MPSSTSTSASQLQQRLKRDNNKKEESDDGLELKMENNDKTTCSSIDNDNDRTILWGRYIFGIIWSFITLVIVIGLIQNKGKKYLRILPQDGCRTSWLDMTAIIINDEINKYKVCCNKNMDPMVDFSHLCSVSVDPITELFATIIGAWLIPLLSVFINILLTLLSSSSSSSSSSNNNASLFSNQKNRLFFYLSIMFYRSFIIYIGGETIESIFQGPEPNDCWYQRFRRGGKCRENFDHADHVVLFLVHFVIISIFELIATLRESKSKWHTLISGALCCLIIGYAIYGAFNTTLYFHTQMECIVGYLIATFLCLIPLISIFEKHISSFVVVGK